MAEAAVDAAIRNRGISKAYGAGPDRELLVSLALPAAELVIKGQQMVKGYAVMQKQSERASLALDRERIALERCEAMYKAMTEMPTLRQADVARRTNSAFKLDEFVMHSRPQVIPEVNGKH